MTHDTTPTETTAPSSAPTAPSVPTVPTGSDLSFTAALQVMEWANDELGRHAATHAGLGLTVVLWQHSLIGQPIWRIYDSPFNRWWLYDVYTRAYLLASLGHTSDEWAVIPWMPF